MNAGGIRFDKKNEPQMKIGKDIIKDVVKKKIKNPDTVVVTEIERAIKYHNSDNSVALPDPISLVEYVTTIMKIRDNGGKWTIDRKRKSAKMEIVTDVYKDVFDDDLEIESGEQITGQISVEDICPLESDPIGEYPDQDDELLEEFNSWKIWAFNFIFDQNSNVVVNDENVVMSKDASLKLAKEAFGR